MELRWSRPLLGLSAIAVLAACGPSQPPRSPMSTRQIVDKYKPAIVRIENDQGVQVGVGTGFVVRRDGRIATNLHVIAGGGRLSVRLANGAQLPVQRIVAVDQARDLAIIDIDADSLPTIVLGDSSAVSAGDRVIAIGNPLKLDYTVSDGLISSVRPLDDDVILQISAPISQGSSGGPLFNSYGEVIGVATLVSSQGQNLNFGVPINYLRPLLGHEGGETPEQFAERFKGSKPEGPQTIQTDSGTITRDVPEHDVAVLDACSRESLIEVYQGVQTAIELGAPVYNRGDHEGCYVIYKQTALHFQRNEAMCPGVRHALGVGLANADKEKNGTAKAWAMRDTFDGLLDVIMRKARAP